MGTFGDFFKSKRVSLSKTLRQFCDEHKLDPGNISKLERGKLPAPLAEEKLQQYAEFLGIEIGSEEWDEFKCLAAVSAGRIPSDLTDKEVLARLPVFFRTLKEKKFSEEDLKELIERIRKA